MPGPDAWRHGRFGLEGQLCSVLVLLGTILLVLLFPSVDDRPKMHDIMAGTDQKYSYVGVGLLVNLHLALCFFLSSGP